MNDSYYTDRALAKQEEALRRQAANESIGVNEMLGIFEPRSRYYGFCPTQLQGHTTRRNPFYFRSRGGHWDLHVGPVDAPADYLMWSGDTQYTVSGEGDIEDPDEVDALVTQHLGEGWTPA